MPNPWAPVWAAIIAAVVSIITCIVTSVVAVRQVRNSHKNELSRKVFVEAAENIEKQIRYLLSFSDLDMSVDVRNDSIKGVATNNAKIHLIASNETIRLLNKANENFSDSGLALIKMQRAVLDQRQKCRTLEDNYDALARKLQEMKDYRNLDGQHIKQPAQVKIEQTLNDGWPHVMAEREKWKGDYKKMTIEIQKRVREFGQHCFSVNISVRRNDLNTPIEDETVYTAQMLTILGNRLDAVTSHLEKL